MTRHKTQVLRAAGHSQREVAQLAGVGERSVRRVEQEEPVQGLGEAADTALRKSSRIARPSRAP